MTDKNKVFSLIGLATRARRVVSGEFSTEKSVKSGRSHMVIVSEEASCRTVPWQECREYPQVLS